MIRIFATGGTFDKEYDMINGRLFFNQTNLDEMLQKGRCTMPYTIETLMMLDSLDMTQTDREKILKHCIETIEDKILITHGTDTMMITAGVIAEHKIPKTIVFTGALIPYSLGSSDGMFNLGSAFAFVQTLPHGVYIVMNGRVFEWDKVRKNKYTGYFESI